MARPLLLTLPVLALMAGAGQGTLARPAPSNMRPFHYEPRPDSIPAALSDEEGQVVANNCMACHSLDYITTQPRGKGAQFWRDEVAKMVGVYKAPVAVFLASTAAAATTAPAGSETVPVMVPRSVCAIATPLSQSPNTSAATLRIQSLPTRRRVVNKSFVTPKR